LRTLKTILIALLLGLMAFVVVGAVLLTLFLPTLLQRFGCAPYGIRCAVGQASIRLRPNLTADLVIDHLTLLDPDGLGTALRVKRLAATMNIPALIRTRQVMPTEVRIESPELLLRQLDDGRWNLSALVQEVQRHLKPATRPTTLPFPRVALTGGALQLGSHRITDVRVTLDPKPVPFLFAMQAQAAVGGRSVQVSGVLNNTLEGQILAQVREEMLRGALRFRLDQPDRAVIIPEWSFEADGALARGTAAVRYGNWPPAYTLTIAQWRADLAAVARQLSVPWLTGLTGMVEGEPATLQGHWPQPPVGEVAVTLTGGGLERPAQQFGVTGLTGRVGLQRPEGSRLRLQATLQGQTTWLLGQRYGSPSLQAVVSVDTASGDVTAEALRASIAGAHLEAKGSGRRWGRDSLDFTTTQLKIEPTFLAQLSRWADAGVLLTTLEHPSIRLRWSGGGRPWTAEIMSRSIHLSATAMNGTATLQSVQIALHGIGVSGRNLEGILAIERVKLAGRPLRALRARFEMSAGRVRVPEFQVAGGGGTIDGHASYSMTAPLREIRVALSVRGLRPQSLFAPTEKSAARQGVTLDADLSADATFGGSQPPTAGGAITLQGLSLSLARQAAEPAPLLTGLRGAVAFTLDNGLLAIKETALRTDGGLSFILAGSLQLGGNGRSASGLHLTIPWTEVAVFRSPLIALTGSQPDAARLAGQFHAKLDLIGQEYYAALSLRHVSMELSGFRLDSASGVIPLHGRIDQNSTASLHQLAAQQKADRSDLTEDEYRAALDRLSNVSAKAPFSLTIDSLRYDPIELRHIEVALASSGSQIAVQRFTFESWGGRWSGWGTIEPLGRGITLAVLTEGLSLRAICDAFPPITGYISGRIYGMVELVVPGSAINQAHGNARFWAVDAPQEKRRISRRLIERLAGQQIRYFSLFGVARRYDRGMLKVALREGDLIFHELEISHTILGYKDLDVRVSPTFNRIGLAHLLESIGEAIERIKASAESNR
jgi:hypothetical protein